MRSMTGLLGLGMGMAVLAATGSVAFAVPPPADWPSGEKETPEPEPELKPGDVNGGQASFTLGKTAVKLPVAEGTIALAEKLYIVDLTFKDLKETSANIADRTGKTLRIGFAASVPGPATLITTFAVKSEGVTSIYRSTPPVSAPGMTARGAGKCTVTVKKIDAKSVEGTAVCPSGMVNFDDEPGPAVTAVTFKATAL